VPQDFESLHTVHAAPAEPPIALPAGGLNLEDVERDLLLQALDRTDWNQTHAGRLLGINRDQVRYRIEKFGLPPAAQQRNAAGIKAG
jgi:transcriptional regulator with GAF, ATPase, and Fis domain